VPAGQVPSVRTIQRHFARLELAGPAAAGTVPETFGRFEASAPGELWVSDVLHGPVIGGQKTYPAHQSGDCRGRRRWRHQRADRSASLSS
jgi:hypothetical protein